MLKYRELYIKYKNKYINLKKQMIGGAQNIPEIEPPQENTSEAYVNFSQNIYRDYLAPINALLIKLQRNSDAGYLTPECINLDKELLQKNSNTNKALREHLMGHNYEDLNFLEKDNLQDSCNNCGCKEYNNCDNCQQQSQCGECGDCNLCAEENTGDGALREHLRGHNYDDLSTKEKEVIYNSCNNYGCKEYNNCDNCQQQSQCGECGDCNLCAEENTGDGALREHLRGHRHYELSYDEIKQNNTCNNCGCEEYDDCDNCDNCDNYTCCSKCTYCSSCNTYDDSSKLPFGSSLEFLQTYNNSNKSMDKSINFLHIIKNTLNTIIELYNQNDSDVESVKKNSGLTIVLKHCVVRIISNENYNKRIYLYNLLTTKPTTLDESDNLSNFEKIHEIYISEKNNIVFIVSEKLIPVYNFVKRKLNPQIMSMIEKMSPQIKEQISAQEGKEISENDIIDIIFQTLGTNIIFLNEQGIYHGDLSLDNTGFRESDGKFVIFDFDMVHYNQDKREYEAVQRM